MCKHPEPKSQKKILNPKKEYDNLRTQTVKPSATPIRVFRLQKETT